MCGMPNGHIQETVGCANAAESRRYSRVKVVPFQTEGFPTRPHPAALVGKEEEQKKHTVIVANAESSVVDPDSLNPDLNPAFQVNQDPVTGF